MHGEKGIKGCSQCQKGNNYFVWNIVLQYYLVDTVLFR